MSYQLGVDLGTTYTAAARAQGGRAEPITLGGRTMTVPSVVYLSGDDLLVGEAAVRRAGSEPSRVAREFKRRVGDPTPLLLGGSPIAAELLMARLLAWVVAQVTATEGGPPASLAVTHPANWGEYKLDLLRQAIRHVDLHVDHFVPEPVAAASFYAAERDLPPGSLVAVYDLGGGTFDAAMVQVDDQGFRIVGRPDGIERLGGIDFDHAVFNHVLGALDIDPEELDPADAALAPALVRLRHDCVEAKEALSSDTEASIPVMLPTHHTVVRLTRQELEDMIRPALAETLTALRRAIASAEAPPEAVSAVLLVGGSSRIPLISQLVTADLRLPVAVDARPKEAIPLGAALLADRAAPATMPGVAVPPVVPTAPPPPAPVTQPTEPQPVGAHSSAPGTDPRAFAAQGPPEPPPMARGGPDTGPPLPPRPGGPVQIGQEVTGGPGLPPGAPTARSRRLWLVAGATAVLTVLVAATLIARPGDEDPDGTSTTTQEVAATTTTSKPDDGTTTTASGSGSTIAPARLPGDDWNGAARTQFVTDCGSSAIGDFASVSDLDPAEACGCLYDEMSTSGLVTFDEFNDSWSSGEDIALDGPVAQAINAATTACVVPLTRSP